MNARPNNPQAVVYNISNTKGNNYVNHAIMSQQLRPQGQSVLQRTQKVKSKQDLHRRLLLMINTISKD